MLLGCIGDDFTGSSDLANTLAKGGMRVTQYCGVPTGPADKEVDAGIVALKSRALPASEAIAQSLEALKWLKDQGCTQFFFKYCSTFDSTELGNIGPVSDAIADYLGARSVIFCPAFPGTGRTVFQGHLFVNDRLLHESGMQNHPINPMTDADIRRWLRHQTATMVEHIPFSTVSKGVEYVRRQLEQVKQKTFFVVDAVSDRDLHVLGQACAQEVFITGGSGIGLGLPDNFRKQGAIDETPAPWQGIEGKSVMLSGSCSIATLQQVEFHKKSHAFFELDPKLVMDNTLSPSDVVQWVLEQDDDMPLIYSSAEAGDVRQSQDIHGVAPLSETLENFFGECAKLLCDAGITKVIVAGGETSGAVVTALGIKSFSIGPEIDPGVPALKTNTGLFMALKSGNFGAPNFFEKSSQLLTS